MSPADALPLLRAAAEAAALPLSALAFLWVAVRPASRRGARPPAPVPPPPDAREVEATYRAAVEADRDPLSDVLSTQLAWRVGGGGVPPAMLDALALIASAAARPEAPDPGILALLETAWSLPNVRRPDLPSDDASDSEIERAMAAHDWWECVLVELMDRARARSSWLTAEDLGFLAGPAPAVLAALCAVPGGTAPHEGAGILAHHACERAAGIPLPTPRVSPASAWLAMRASAGREP